MNKSRKIKTFLKTKMNMQVVQDTFKEKCKMKAHNNKLSLRNKIMTGKIKQREFMLCMWINWVQSLSSQ